MADFGLPALDISELVTTSLLLPIKKLSQAQAKCLRRHFRQLVSGTAEDWLTWTSK